MFADFVQQPALMQKHQDFLYDLYAECMTIHEIIAIAQQNIELEPERRAICDVLINLVEEDACHLSDADLATIQQIADTRSLRMCGTDEGVRWGALYDCASVEIYERAEGNTCPDCGGDMRFGEHQVQVDADYFVCRTEPIEYADYLHEALFDK